MIDLYAKLAIPDTCRLGKRVFKKLFYENENAPLKAADKKAFSEDVDSIEWLYTLKPETINIPRYRDEEKEYDEIAVIETRLKAVRRYQRIAKIIHRAIPYPVLLVLRHEASIVLSVADKRINRADREKILVENFEETGWIDLEAPSQHENNFLESLNITELSFNNFYDFYCDVTERIIGLHCAEISGNYTVKFCAEVGDRAKLLATIRNLEKKLTELQSELKKESRFSEKVTLNIEIKQIRQQLEAHKAEL